MDFRVLGPLEVLRNGRALPLGGPRQRAVLAALLLHPNTPLSLERLVELAWDAPPDSAEANVRKFIWQLRKTLNDPLETSQRIVREHGFRIIVRPGELDLWRFTELAESARIELESGHVSTAAEKYAHALAMADGTPLAGVRLESRLASVRTDLRERTEAVEEQYFRTRLELGEHRESVGELRAILARQPLREPVAALLMLALYRSGRQDKALAVFRDTRARLIEELGVEPGAELRLTHRRVLRGDPALDAAGVRARPTAGPAQLPLDVTGFSGRAEALTELDRVRERAASGTGGAAVCALSGTAGVGKTALAVHWAHTVAHHFPDGQLYVNLRGFDPEKAPMDAGEALTGFLDALGVPATRIPAGREAQSALFRSLLAGRRTLVVVDNARDTEQVRPLLAGAPGVFTVVTSRSRLTNLIASGCAYAMSLDVLTLDESGALLAARLGDERVHGESGAVSRIVERCARLPLALAMVAARAATRPDFPLAVFADELDETAGTLDLFGDEERGADLRSTFSWSYSALADEPARLFRLLGLHPGPEVSVPAAASLAGIDAAAARRLLAELDRARLIDERAPGRYSFHDLLRSYACELAWCGGHAADRDAAMHRMTDHFVHSAAGAAALLDRHRRPVVLDPPAADTVVTSVAGADAAATWFGREEPVLLGAVDAAYRAGLDGHAWRLAWQLSPHLRRRGAGRSWIPVLRTGLMAAERAEDRLGTASCHYLLAVAQFRHGDRAEAARHRDAAMAAYADLGDDYGRACCTYVRCWECEENDDYAGALVAAEEILALFRSAGHAAGEGRALGMVGWLHARLGDHDAGLRCCRAALAVLDARGDTGGVAPVWDTIGFVHHARGDYPAAVEAYGRSVALYRELGDRFNVVTPLLHAGESHSAGGDPGAARAARRQALDVLDELADPRAAELRAELDAAR